MPWRPLLSNVNKKFRRSPRKNRVSQAATIQWHAYARLDCVLMWNIPHVEITLENPSAILDWKEYRVELDEWEVFDSLLRLRLGLAASGHVEPRATTPVPPLLNSLPDGLVFSIVGRDYRVEIINGQLVEFHHGRRNNVAGQQLEAAEQLMLNARGIGQVRGGPVWTRVELERTRKRLL